MRAVVQRVRDAKVVVDNQLEGAIASGLLVYLAVGQGDDDASVAYLSQKVVDLRIFPDDAGKMNLSLIDLRSRPAGKTTTINLPGILVVSQFTLYGDVRKGRRPSYNLAAQPAQARRLYEGFLAALNAIGIPPESGRFQEHMDVTYTNDGPVTIVIDTEHRR